MNPWRPRRGNLDLLWALLVLGLTLTLLTGAAQARTKQAAIIDDDWDPIERSYSDDPGYEAWLLEALDIAGFEYEVFENQTLGNPPQLPALEDLIAFPLVIWNCAAESRRALTLPERELIRAYRDLGGKMMILGHGILNSIQLELQENPDNPELYEFLGDQLGVSDFFLDEYVETLLPPSSGVPYLDFLTPVELDYSDLPDIDPTLADIVYPTQGVAALLKGQLVSGGIEPVSTDRYLPAPVHFQPVLVEAIPNPSQRAEYLLAFSEWLGFEGDELLDFMLDSDLFGPISECPPNLVDWSPGPNALVFEAWGSTDCAAALGFDLSVGDEPCDWRIGFTHRLTLVNAGSEMVLMDLGDGEANHVKVTAVPGQTSAEYGLKLEVMADGSVVHESLVESLGVGFHYRTHLIMRGDIEELELRVMDFFGYPIGGFQLTGLRPVFSQLHIATVGLDTPVEGPTRGQIDDYFLEGCLYANGTAVSELPQPAPRLSAHPNPFNPSTRIHVDLPRAGSVRLSVHDLSGRELRLLSSGWRDAGRLELDWDGRDGRGRRLGSGVYLLRLSGADVAVGTKLLLLK